MKNSTEIIKHTREELTNIIAYHLPANPRCQMTFHEDACVHEVYAGAEEFVEIFKRAYYAPHAKEIVLEYTDHILKDQGKPRSNQWNADELDAFSIDELLVVAKAVENKKYVIEENLNAI